MKNISTEQEYKALTARMEALLKLVGNDTPTTDKHFIELDTISNLVADYEEMHHPINESNT